jgi:Na+-driven multidrug efflux pump
MVTRKVGETKTCVISTMYFTCQNVLFVYLFIFVRQVVSMGHSMKFEKFDAL